jgi:hypothetical protein
MTLLFFVYINYTLKSVVLFFFFYNFGFFQKLIERSENSEPGTRFLILVCLVDSILRWRKQSCKV